MPSRLPHFSPLRSFRPSDPYSKSLVSNSGSARAVSLSQGEIHKLITIDVSHNPNNRRRVPVVPSLVDRTRGDANTNRAVSNVIDKALQRGNARRSANADVVGVQDTVAALSSHQRGVQLGLQIHRRWKAGDVYAPHDLTGVEMGKWRRRGTPQVDAFDALDMNPIDQYKNFSILSEYMTPMGRIKPNSETGLRRVNQRRIAKAIRRSVGLGIMPSVHYHPEILYNDMLRKGGDVWRTAKNAMAF